MLRVGVIGCGGMGKDHIKRLTNKMGRKTTLMQHQQKPVIIQQQIL